VVLSFTLANVNPYSRAYQVANSQIIYARVGRAHDVYAIARDVDSAFRVHGAPTRYERRDHCSAWTLRCWYRVVAVVVQRNVTHVHQLVNRPVKGYGFSSRSDHHPPELLLRVLQERGVAHKVMLVSRGRGGMPQHERDGFRPP